MVQFILRRLLSWRIVNRSILEIWTGLRSSIIAVLARSKFQVSGRVQYIFEYCRKMDLSENSLRFLLSDDPVDILPFLKEGDSYGVLQVLQNRFGRYFRPARNYPNLSTGTHVGSIACGNLLYEIVISSRIDMGNIMASERFKEKRHANHVLKDEVCACPQDHADWHP